MKLLPLIAFLLLTSCAPMGRAFTRIGSWSQPPQFESLKNREGTVQYIVTSILNAAVADQGYQGFRVDPPVPRTLILSAHEIALFMTIHNQPSLIVCDTVAIPACLSFGPTMALHFKRLEVWPGPIDFTTPDNIHHSHPFYYRAFGNARAIVFT